MSDLEGTGADGAGTPEEPAEGADEKRMSRRSVLVIGGSTLLGAAALSGAGAIGYAWPRSSAPATTTTTTEPTKRVPRFRSQPDLDPPVITVTNLQGATDSGYIFITPSVLPGARTTQAKATAEGLGQEGLLMLDQFGEVVWFEPMPNLATNLRVQTYRGEPVITYWHGAIKNGIGKGEGVILDSSYRTVTTVHAGNGLEQDLHDFSITDRNTALITAYTTKHVDLRSVGGPKDGVAQDSIVQEIDIATGKVLFEWHSLDHVPVEETHAKYKKGAPFDYFHINSVSPDLPGNILVSARNTWALYQIDGSSGKVNWRLGGKTSDFKLVNMTPFAWQHHTTRLADGNISIFDDGAAPQVEPQSRALIVSLDMSAHEASIVHQYTHPARLVTDFEGSAEVMPDKHMFVGWGAEPYFSEFDENGKLVIDGRFPTNDQSYRVFRMPWTGVPASKPAIATETDEVGGLNVYASWNGATEVASWRILTGSAPHSLAQLITVPATGFETSIMVHTKNKYVAAAALDATGKQLGVSEAHKA